MEILEVCLIKCLIDVYQVRAFCCISELLLVFLGGTSGILVVPV